MAGVKGMKHYDAFDYRDELQELVVAGMTTKEFIARSEPSGRWFRMRVKPICTLSLCHGCGRHFNPQVTGSLIECKKPRCPISLDVRNV